MKRVQLDYILKDLTKKMVLIAGPRQAGKTWLAKKIAAFYQHPIYLNYDSIDDRTLIEKQNWLPKQDLVILDELHKMPDWKNYLKGLYDTKAPSQHLLVTGSARLETFYEVGDSLAGRYFLHHLLPFSLAELKQINQPLSFDHILEFGNFPEPLFAESLLDTERWRLQYIDSLIRTDVLNFENIQSVKSIQTLFELLRRRVGSTISYTNLARDLSIAPNTVKKYISILEALYIVFRITPYSNNIARSLLKDPKIYFYDSNLINNDEGAKIENFAAVSLLKHCYAMRDYQARMIKLHYLRTKDGREVDFALIENDKVQKALEIKLSDTKLNPALAWYHKKYGFPCVQLVKNLKHENIENSIEILRLEAFLGSLYL